MREGRKLASVQNECQAVMPSHRTISRVNHRKVQSWCELAGVVQGSAASIGRVAVRSVEDGRPGAADCRGLEALLAAHDEPRRL